MSDTDPVSSITPGVYDRAGLEPNRVGHLAAAQRSAVLSETSVAMLHRAVWAGPPLILLGLALIASLSLALGDTSPPYPADPTRGLTPALPVALGMLGCSSVFMLGGFMVFKALRHLNHLRLDLRDGRVDRVDGSITEVPARGSGRRAAPFSDLRVAPNCFRMYRDACSRASGSGRVRLFFLPLSRLVVNFELLADEASPGFLPPQ